MNLQGYCYTLTDADRQLASVIASKQHASSGARGTRGAGSNHDFRFKGVLGEIVVARILGISPQVDDFGGPTSRPDIILVDGTAIEVKYGLPMEGKSKLRPTAYYAVVCESDQGENVYCISRYRKGEDILRDGIEPPQWMCPRPGTRELNWLISA